jgi:hypothetical protein
MGTSRAATTQKIFFFCKLNRDEIDILILKQRQVMTYKLSRLFPSLAQDYSEEPVTNEC